MENIAKIEEIAEYLGFSNIVSELREIDFRSKQENANLILPLVGEFSSGKTTLINSLTDSKKLETATKPTTATIYEVHFGCDSCHAKVLSQEGSIQEVNDIADLKNDVLADAKVVTVFDTSKRVPATTILVDTPGLSSPDPKHKQTLVNFLPKADGIMLVTDINQQITRSLTDFIDTMKLSKRPIYLILTKSDTKSATDIESAKKYISDNCQIPLKQLAVVSAVNNDLDELYSLLDSIQKDKKEILKQVDGQRIKNIVNLLTEHIETLMNASNSDKELDEAIRRSQYELDKISRNIDRLVDSMSDDIEEQERTVSRKFEDTVFSKLNTLVTGKSSNFDGEAISTINNIATLLMNDYKAGIQDLLRNKARSQKGTDNEVPLTSLENMDLSSIQMSGLSYNLDLNTMGHEYDGLIVTGLKVVGTAAALYVGAGAAGAAGALDAADTASDILCDGDSVVSKVTNNGNGSAKPIVESLVGLVTDATMSKPQRVRAVRNYVDGSLAPEFKSGLRSISQTLINSIRCNLQNEASVVIGQKTDSLNQLRQEMQEKKDLFKQRLGQLREYKTILLTI